MPTSYEEWKNYDPNDDQYLSTAEIAGKRFAAGWEHAKRWGKSVGSDIATGAPIYAAGAGLAALPWGPAKAVGNLGKLIGGMQMQWAPITATRQTIDDITQPEEPPQTDAQHLKKWLKNTGTGAGIGLSTAAVGKGIMMIPHPIAKAIGGGLYGTGMLATKFAPVEATAELWIDKLFRNGKPRPTPPPEPAKDYRANLYGAGITGAAGLAGAYALTGLIPAIRRRKALRTAAIIAAALGAGYLGWKETDRANNLSNIG